MRIVSLTCSNTEIVAALGCGDLLVGVDDHSDHPAELLASIPRVGPDLGIDVERVRALRPDLVLASLTVPGHEKVVEALRVTGLPFVAPAPESLEDIYRDIAEIARLLEVEERGRRLVGGMRDAIAAAAPRDGTERASAPAVLVEWWPKPVFVPGRRCWVNGLLEAVGGRNPFAARDAHSVAVTPQEVRAAPPDAIVVSWCGVAPSNYRLEQVYGRAGWERLPAVQHRRVHAISEEFLGRPGPRVVEGCRRLARIVAECHAAHRAGSGKAAHPDG